MTGSDSVDEKEIKERYNVERRLREIERYNHNIREEYNVFKSKKDAFLFICIIKTTPQRPKDPIKIKIFVFENQNSYLHVLEKEDAKQVENGWKDLLEKLKNKNVGEIRKCGDFFYEKLLGNKLILPGILSNERNGMGGIWILCTVAIIDPIWEWLCTKFSNGEGFFWGDKFSIIRLPIDGNFEIERSESQIKSVAILLDKTCDCAISDMKCLSNLCQHPIQISNYHLKSLHNKLIGRRDYMHIAADIRLIEKNYDDIIQAVKIAASLSEKLFVFYNIWNEEEPRSMHDIRLKVVNSIPAKTRIYTSFDVPKYFATLFAKCFYDCVVEENDVAKAIKKAREEIKNGYLFSTTNGELEKDLNDRNIQEGSKEIFKQHIQLSNDLFVEDITEENDVWMLSDRKNGKTYRIKKKDGKLTIYETDRNVSSNRFWRFAYVVNGNPFTTATWVRS